MVATGTRRKSIIFATLGFLCVAVAIGLNIGWVILNWKTGVLALLGILFFGIVVMGLILNTTFLIREIRRNEQHDAFINAVTHELKTPIASIRLYLETLQTRPLDDQKRQEFYKVMLRDSERLLHTVEQVLRAGQGARRSAHNEPVNLNELVRECVELAQSRHRLPPEAVTFAGGAAGVTVEGDAEELKSAFSNLIDNAVKYSGETVCVRVRMQRTIRDTVAVTVEDQGVGIAPPELKRIFRRFYRVPGSLSVRVKGTGLGLFIVRTVAKRHGGRAFAESDGTGKGSRFTVELPEA